MCVYVSEKLRVTTTQHSTTQLSRKQSRAMIESSKLLDSAALNTRDNKDSNTIIRNTRHTLFDYWTHCTNIYTMLNSIQNANNNYDQYKSYCTTNNNTFSANMTCLFLYFVFCASGSAIKYAKSHSAADLMNKTSSGVCINDYNAIAMCTQTIMLILIQQAIYSHTIANSSQMAIIFT